MKKLEGFSGFLPASMTPFNAEGKVNTKALMTLMSRNLDEGAVGFLIGGSSAESSLLSREERIILMEAAANHPRRAEMKLIGSCAAIAECEAVEYAKKAEALGFDAVISTAPYYYKFGMKGVAHYMSSIRESVDLPLFVYNFPGNTGVELDINDPAMRAILTDGTVAGVKQTSLNLYQLERLRDMNPELVIYGGYDEVYLGARILGADGAIGSTFNFTLPLFVQIEKAYAAHDIPTAQALQRRANNIMQAMVSCGLFPSIKHMLSVLGVDCGMCRAPFTPLTAEQKAFVEKVVSENL